MRELRDLNDEIKEKIQKSSSIEVFDALDTLSKDEFSEIKKEIFSSCVINETIKKYLSFYPYVFLEYALLSYDMWYGSKESGRKIYPLFIPEVTANFRNKITGKIIEIIQREYHLTNEKSKNFSEMLKYSGLPKNYKMEVFEEIKKLILKNKKYRDPEYSKEINEKLISKSFKHNPKSKLKEYLLFNGEHIVEDFFESDFNSFEDLDLKSEALEDMSINSEFNESKIQYFFRRGKLIIEIHNPKNLKFEIYKRDQSFECLNKTEISYVVDPENDSHFKFNGQVLKDILNFKDTSKNLQLMIFNRKTGKSVFYCSLEKEDFKKNGLNGYDTEKLIKSGYQILFIGNTKLNKLYTEDNSLISLEHNFPKNVKAYELVINKEKTLYLSEIFKINIKVSSKFEKRIIFDERSKRIQLFDKKKFYYEDLYFSLATSEEIDMSKVRAEVGGISAERLDDNSFFIAGNEIPIETGLRIIKIRFYYKEKIIKTYHAIYGKNYTGNNLEFYEPVSVKGVELINGFVENNIFKVNNDAKYMTILLSKGNVVKKIHVKNPEPVIDIEFENGKKVTMGFADYEFKPDAESYKIWFSKGKGELLYNIDNNKKEEFLEKMSIDSPNYVSKYRNNSGFKELSNVLFRHSGKCIKLFEKDNRAYYNKQEKNYEFESVLGDLVYCLKEFYFENGKLHIKFKSISPSPGEHYKIKEDNNRGQIIYMSCLSIKSSINSPAKRYECCNVREIDLSDAIRIDLPKKCKEWISLLSKQNWKYYQDKSSIEELRLKLISNCSLVKELKDFHYKKQYEKLLSNVSMIENFKNINLFKNYKDNIGIDFINVFSKASGFYYQPDNLLEMKNKPLSTQFTKNKKITVAYFNYLLNNCRGLEDWNTPTITKDKLRNDYSILYELLSINAKNIKQSELVLEVMYIVDLLHRSEEEFDNNYHKSLNMDTILCDCTELLEYIYILGKLINKGAPYERSQPI